MKIKAVLFDMDGVLIDAKDWHYEAMNKALSLFGYTIARYEHLTSYDGLPTSVKLEKLSVEKGLPRSLHKFINEMKQRYTMTEIHNKCRPVFIHEYALSRLKSEGFRDVHKITFSLALDIATFNLRYPPSLLIGPKFKDNLPFVSGPKVVDNIIISLSSP